LIDKLIILVLAVLTLAVPASGRNQVTEQKVRAALPSLDALMEQALQKTGIPGVAIAVVYKDRVIYLKVLAFARQESWRGLMRIRFFSLLPSPSQLPPQ
jgi:CubicO group peptidase (beta-lactamase class C family)